MAVFRAMKNTTLFSMAVNFLAASSGISTALDVVSLIPGAATSCVLASLGVGVIPFYSDKKLIGEYERRWRQREDKLDGALESLCSKELSRIHKRILDGVSPYTRYVKTEQEAISDLNEDCDKLTGSTQVLRNKITRLR